MMVKLKTIVLVVLVASAVLSAQEEFSKGDLVVVAGEKAPVYRGTEVIFTATGKHTLKVLSLNGKWLAVSWSDNGEAGTGWIAATQIRKAGADAATASEVDVSHFTDASKGHPKKRQLDRAMRQSSGAFAQKAVSYAEDGLKSDNNNAVFHYLIAKGKIENSQWSSALKALDAGHRSPAAYEYVMEGGMEAFLSEPAHLDGIQFLAKSLQSSAAKRSGEEKAELLSHLYQLGSKMAQCRPYSTLNVRLGLALMSIANNDRKKADIPVEGEKWLGKIQGTLAQQESEEILIVRKYLAAAGLGESTEPIMGFLLPLSMSEASGIKREAKKRGPVKIAKGDDGTQRRGFFRRASSYDFLGAMVTEASGETTEEQDEDQDMLEFFSGQEKRFLDKLQSKTQQLRIKTAKEFLAASLSGQDSALFRKLMSPKSLTIRNDRKRWDEACDKALKVKAEKLATLIGTGPEG